MATTKKKATGILVKRSTGDYIFDTINVIIMLLLCLVTLYPMYFVICASFTKNTYLVAHPGAVFYPVGFTVGSYKLAFSHPLLLSGYKNILIVLDLLSGKRPVLPDYRDFRRHAPQPAHRFRRVQTHLCALRHLAEYRLELHHLSGRAVRHRSGTV